MYRARDHLRDGGTGIGFLKILEAASAAGLGKADWTSVGTVTGPDLWRRSSSPGAGRTDRPGPAADAGLGAARGQDRAPSPGRTPADSVPS
jgi:hypothetical protein